MARTYPAHDRKHFLYRHRSFRFAPLQWSAVFTSILLPAAITWYLATHGGQIMQFHENLRRVLLSWSGVPLHETAPLVALQGFAISSPVTAMASYKAHAWLPWVVCGLVVLLLGAAYHKVPLSRGMMWFGFVLLLASAVPAMLSQQADDSSFFISFWLRCEFVIWFFIPWIISMLAGFVVPSLWARAFWTLVASVYGVFWSAARLVFCCGLLYLAGPVLILPLWFSLGILADLVALCVFYSFAVYHAGWVHESVSR